MENRSALSLKNLLEEKIAELDQKLLHMQAVRKTLCNYRQNMVTLLTMDLSEITIVNKQERCLVTVDIDKETSFEQEVELFIDSMHGRKLADGEKLFFFIHVSIS